MFFGNYYNFIFSNKKVHSFKVFKRSTKFKRYNRGHTKFVLNRKKYTLRKKITTSYTKFKVPLSWSIYFSKKRQLTRFYQYYFILDYNMSLANQSILLNLRNSIDQNQASLGFNFSFLTKNILRNSSLFPTKVFLNLLNFFENMQVSFLHTTSSPSITNFPVTSNVLSGNFFIANTSNNRAINESYLIKNLNNNILKIFFLILKVTRAILIHITLLLIFK